jgi:uracil-DNA glycosylase family 4
LRADGKVLTTPALSALEEKISRCRKCTLWKGAINAVPGEGPADAKVMLIGQNPGAEEDKIGRLLVEVEIPRVEKKDVTVHMSEDRFHITLRFVRG